MTTVQITLPDQLAEDARRAGLLSDRAIRQLLEEAMRRETGRKLLAVADRLRAADIPSMRDEEVVAEVKAVRAERRARSKQP